MARKKIEKSEKQKLADEANQLTWLLKGRLKSAQLHYLTIAAMLIRVRDRKLFAVVKCASLEEYAEKKLGMKKSSLYKYLQVYEWVAEFHKAWLLPKPKGFIPELNDVTDLMWIERKLTEKGLKRQTRSELETMQKAALEGSLKDSDLETWRKVGGRIENALRTFLGKIRLLRRRGSQVKNMPNDAITHLDAAIESIRNAVSAE